MCVCVKKPTATSMKYSRKRMEIAVVRRNTTDAAGMSGLRRSGCNGTSCIVGSENEIGDGSPLQVSYYPHSCVRLGFEAFRDVVRIGESLTDACRVEDNNPWE